MKRLKFVFVGACKASHFAQASRFYHEALSRYCPVEIETVRDAPSQENLQARLRKESRSILSCLTPRDLVVGLDERGRAFPSRDFAAKLARWFEDPGRQACFVVGGPFGFASEVTDRFQERLSLGPATLPHELARVVLLEQLYRAATILAGHPYHHD
ncbi:23S rRNA (pseudouridine(1915)-N(3))-methyltransferase RlmH [Fundidesulfovibrio butyratiphilus]